MIGEFVGLNVGEELGLLGLEVLGLAVDGVTVGPVGVGVLGLAVDGETVG